MSVRDPRVSDPRQAASPPPPGLGGWRRLRPVVAIARMVALLAVLLLVYMDAPWSGRLDVSIGAQLLGWLAVLAVVVTVDVRMVLRSRRPWQRAAEGAVLSIALLLLPFASGYVLLDTTVPGSFTEHLSRVDGLYFAVTVFSTVGFGDITPVTEQARVLVTVQILADLVMIGVITKVLLGAAQLHYRRLRNPSPSTPEDEEDDVV